MNSNVRMNYFRSGNVAWADSLAVMETPHFPTSVRLGFIVTVDPQLQSQQLGKAGFPQAFYSAHTNTRTQQQSLT